MESAFARLYRTSKLASYDRSIKQIYTTYGRNARNKDWGLKRPMPSKMETMMATIGSLDTKEQIVDFVPANKEYLMLNSWKENFTRSRVPHSGPPQSEMIGMFDVHDEQGSQVPGPEAAKPRARGPLRSLGKMSPGQWKRFLDEARARRAEWKGELAKGNYAPEEALTFMGATNATSAAGDGVHRQPEYHDYVPPGESLQVQGRLLGRVGSMYTVAVQGIVATLPLGNHAMEPGFQYRDVKTFYVHSAEFDHRGLPHVVLGMSPLGARESTISFRSSNRGMFAFSKSRTGKNPVRKDYLDHIKDMMSDNIRKSKAANTDPVEDTVDFLDKNRK
ncbi:hypothetical protein IWW51_002137 [Coemansia sp. RSA 2702]|nr:hypothetical protein IWW51_002137 [Coemansia sp. RSA 2702]